MVISGSTGTASSSFAARACGGIAACCAATAPTVAASAAISSERRTRTDSFMWAFFRRLGILAGLQILLGCSLVSDRRHLVRIDADHQIVNVIVNLREPVSGTGGNDDDVASLEVVALPVDDLRAVVARRSEEHTSESPS